MMLVDSLNASNATAVKEYLSVLERRLESVDFNNDAFFLLSMSVVIFLMQAGFAFLEAGSVRSKNTTNILIKNLLDSCISAIAFWLVGYAFAYGNGFGGVKPNNGFIGYGNFAMVDLPSNDYPKWFFQFVFAATCSTIVSGALAERCEFLAYMAYCGILTAFVYPVVAHWAWGGGWLHTNSLVDVSFKDFAGSGVVHVLGGAAAFVGAAVLGPRIGRFDSSDKSKFTLAGHSVPFAALGGFILMFGFFAFNGGSQTSISHKGDGAIVARAMVNTMLSGAGAGITVLLINKILFNHKWSLLLSINAVLTGMVSACSGCDVLEPWAALLVGIGAGVSYMTVSYVVEKVKVDDPLDAVGVHFGGGMWGILFTPVIMNDGVLLGRTTNSLIQLLWNAIGGIAITVWTVVTMGGLFVLLRVAGMFRVEKEVEEKGLDMFKHGETAYPLIAYGNGWEQMHGIDAADIGNVRFQYGIDGEREEIIRHRKMSVGAAVMNPIAAEMVMMAPPTVNALMPRGDRVAAAYGDRISINVGYPHVAMQ